MKIRYEDYPLLSGGIIKATSYNNDKTLLLHRNNVVKKNRDAGKRIYFTDTAIRLVQKNTDLINSIVEVSSKNFTFWTEVLKEGSYCILFKNGISTYLEVDHRMPSVVPYSFNRNEIIEANFETDLGPAALACLIWYQKAELNEVTLDSIKRKVKTQNDSYFNETKSDVKVIDVNWNTTTIQTAEFWVKAHAAIRWVGEGRKDFKIVMISPYKKNGYVRKAGIIKETN